MEDLKWVKQLSDIDIFSFCKIFSIKIRATKIQTFLLDFTKKKSVSKIIETDFLKFKQFLFF